eukprot:3043374-Rhodomonas_salina.1
MRCPLSRYGMSALLAYGLATRRPDECGPPIPHAVCTAVPPDQVVPPYARPTRCRMGRQEAGATRGEEAAQNCWQHSVFCFVFGQNASNLLVNPETIRGIEFEIRDGDACADAAGGRGR